MGKLRADACCASGRRALVASLLFCCACSLLDLDDFAASTCSDVHDCYALGSQLEDGLLACYRCNAGRCERTGIRQSQETEEAEPLAWLSHVELESSEWRVLAGEGRNGSRSARAYRARDGRLSAEEPFSYWTVSGDDRTALQEGCPVRTPSGQLGVGECDVAELALASLSSRYAAAVSINTLGCESGQVRVGLIDSHAPSRILLDVGAAQALGIDPDARARCTSGSGQLGAHAPVAASLARGEGKFEVLAIWSAGMPSASTPEQACAASDSQPVRGVVLSLQGDGESAQLGAISALPLGRSAPDVKPGLIAARFQHWAGYLLATAHGGSLKLSLFASGDLAEPAGQLEIADAAATQLAIASGGTTPAAERRVLVAWRAGCGEAAVLRFGIFAWRGRELTPLAPLAALRPRGALLAGPMLMYSPHGFRTTAPRGGWLLAWLERRARETQLVAERISEAELRGHGVVTVLERDDLELTFLAEDDRQFFVAGGVRAQSETRSKQVMVRSCDALRPPGE